MKNIYVGGYGAGNFGDDLILTSILSEDPDATIVSYGKPFLDWDQPYILFREFMKNAHEIIAGHDALIFGGGGLFWSHDHIYEMVILALIAKNLGVRVELRRIGLHGFQLNIAASQHLFRLADVVTFRENDSLDLARHQLDYTEGFFEEDYAQKWLNPVASIEKPRPRIGVNIANTKFTIVPGFTSHVSVIYAELARRFGDKADFFYVPFCLHISEPSQNDLARADALFAASEGRIKYSAGIRSVEQLLTECSRTDIFIGERFHMQVVGQSYGRSVIPLIHNEQTKYHAFCHDHGQIPVFYETSQAMIIDQISERLYDLLDLR